MPILPTVTQDASPQAGLKRMSGDGPGREKGDESLEAVKEGSAHSVDTEQPYPSETLGASNAW